MLLLTSLSDFSKGKILVFDSQTLLGINIQLRMVLGGGYSGLQLMAYGDHITQYGDDFYFSDSENTPMYSYFESDLRYQKIAGEYFIWIKGQEKKLWLSKLDILALKSIAKKHKEMSC